MHLNRALVSSLLFVSVVLAEDSPMAGAQFDSIVDPRLPGYKRAVNEVFGRFKIPLDIRGPVGSGFTIAIGLDLSCPTATASAGVTVYMTGPNEPWIRGWFAFGPFWHEEWIPAPFNILRGDTIAIRIKLPKLEEPGVPQPPRNMRANFHVEVLARTRRGQPPPPWVGYVLSVPRHPLCEDNAFWTVGSVYTADHTGVLPLADFGEVLFEEVRMFDEHGHAILSKSHKVTDLYIVRNGQRMTSLEVKDAERSIQKAHIRVRYGDDGSQV